MGLIMLIAEVSESAYVLKVSVKISVAPAIIYLLCAAACIFIWLKGIKDAKPE